jgi:hypothetical protein
MRILAVTIVALGVLFAAGPSVAQQPDDLPYTEYTLPDDLVEGQLLQPMGDLELRRRLVTHTSLIVIRSTWVPELLKSTESM